MAGRAGQVDPARSCSTTTDEELPAKVVFQAADRGDEVAQKIVDDTAYYLAVGAMNMMHIIDPDMVVFAGGMIAAGEPFLNRIKHHIRETGVPGAGGANDRSLRGTWDRRGLHRRRGVCSAVGHWAGRFGRHVAVSSNS